MPRAGVFVSGTDTGIGKTLVAACLVHRWRADYWKPVQTGLAQDTGDSETVAALAGGQGRIVPPRHVFQAPLSPEAAAVQEGRQVGLDDFALPPGRAPIVVEGAGGVLVPLGGGATMAELMHRLGLPVLLVIRGTLGTINHSLLSLEALRARAIAVAGIVVCGQERDGNAATVARLGGVSVLGVVPPLPSVTPAAIAEAAASLRIDPPLAAGASRQDR